MNKFILSFILLMPAAKMQMIKPVSWSVLDIAEPSGICITDDQHYFIASNNGVFCEVDSKGKLLRSEHLGMDIEDVCSIGTDIYVLDESLRLVYMLDEKTWKKKRTFSINYNGARNKGFESLTFIPEKKHFILITEKQPLYLVETDENFNPLNHVEINSFSDLSSATYYNHKLWLLSDEDHVVIKMNTDDFSVEKKWSVPVYNPEGICFDPDGTMRIVSDDTRRLYIFPNPEKE